MSPYFSSIVEKDWPILLTRSFIVSLTSDTMELHKEVDANECPREDLSDKAPGKAGEATGIYQANGCSGQHDQFQKRKDR